MSQQPQFQTYMQRIEPEHNMRRFYHLSIQQNLFGEVSLMRNWGRIGSAGQVKTQTFAGEDDAQARFTQLFRAKCKRGLTDGIAVARLRNECLCQISDVSKLDIGYP